ncbi:MAG: S8 family serine peptidase [Bacteroidales bacterium]|nr:S8 family serine peptidase [Bacteroidales bacterium]
MPPKETGPHYVEGTITVKLRQGIGEFGKQTGDVHFGIKSLDDKVADFEIYELDKRFKHNPSKLQSDLPDLSRIYKLSFPVNYPIRQVVNAFSSDPNVEYAEPLQTVQLLEIPDDVLYAQQQHLTQIFAPQAWDIHKGENGAEETVIAIIDTGVDWDHPDLINNVWQNLDEDADGDGHTLELSGFQWSLDPGDLNGIDNGGNGFIDDLIGWNFITNDGDPNPIQGNPDGAHGTHCAGISNGVTNNGTGIASIGWNLTLMPVCVIGNNTNNGYDGMIYAAENGADIISASWGNWEYSEADQEVIDYVTGLGSIVVAAAGNNNDDYPMYPSSYLGVISVASVNVDDTKAAYSSFGPPVDISVPGGGSEGGILSTMPGGLYQLGFGTSMATPLVAGCFGLLKSYRPAWTNHQLINQLLGTADNIDNLNPGYEHQLGLGRVNAFRLLSEVNVTAPQILELGFISMNIEDDNGNLVNEPGEEITLSPSFRNFSQYAGDNQVIATLSTDDDDVIILNGTVVVNIPPDGIFSIEDQFRFEVGEDATSHFVVFNITFDSDLEIVTGEVLNVEVLVAPSGTFIFEGEPNGQDYSGAYIKNVLDQLGIHNTYSNTYPATLEGFENVFLSQANTGELQLEGSTVTVDQALMIQEFLESGGHLYIESGGFFSGMQYYGYPNYLAMKQLFGVSSNSLVITEHPLDSLKGAENSPFQGITFNQSTQLHNWWIDKLISNPGAIIPFREHNYGNVSIMNEGTIFNHKAFYMGYALAELSDRTPVISKNNVLLKVLDFFEILPENYILANFIADKKAGGVPMNVNFTDYSLPDASHPILTWQWDFNNDGIIDSYVQNPSWTYNEPGIFDVKLIVSNEVASDTIVKQGFIEINTGYLVYEGVPGGNGYSGSFIRDYLQDHVYTVTYRNSLPESLDGFTAVFLSYGNYNSRSTKFDADMAKILGDYLDGGGYVYLEGGDPMGFDQVENVELHEKFGILSATDGTENPVDRLEGQTGSLSEDLLFTGSHQLTFSYIDQFVPTEDAVAAFVENGYGIVAVQHSVPGAHRTFCFSYALAELNDGENPNTREQLMESILNFFDINTAVPQVNKPQDDRFNVYPNPADNQITVSAPGLSGYATITLFTLTGQVVMERKFTGMEDQLDISTLPPGMYIIELLTDQGKVRKKLMVE